MIEYLYNAIRAVAGQAIDITAYITDENEELVTENCDLNICNQDGTDVLLTKEGLYDVDNSVWHFLLAPEETKGFSGRYLYYIRHDDSNLCFKQPIYFK